MYIYDPDSEPENIDSILAAIREIEIVGSGTGAIIFAHTAGSTFTLNNEKLEILPQTEKCFREVWLTNKSSESFEVWVNGLSIGTISPGQSWRDMFNSGMKIEARGIGNIQIIVRSDKPINLISSEEPMIPIEIQLYLGTGINYSNITQPYQDVESTSFDNNLNKFFNSEMNLDGYKLIGFHSFPFATKSMFTVLLEDGGLINPNAPIKFYWLNPVIAAKILIAIASDVINPETNLIDSRVSGLLSTAGFGGETIGGSGAIQITPSIINHFGRFSALRADTGTYDTAIISHYTPNSDPLLGGTFHLIGF